MNHICVYFLLYFTKCSINIQKNMRSLQSMFTIVTLRTAHSVCFACSPKLNVETYIKLLVKTSLFNTHTPSGAIMVFLWYWYRFKLYVHIGKCWPVTLRKHTSAATSLSINTSSGERPLSVVAVRTTSSEPCITTSCSFGTVGKEVGQINEVTLRWTRLVLGWVTVSGFNSQCGKFISV